MLQDFDPKCLLKPDFHYYARMDFWTGEEAIHLLAGVRPLSEFPLPEFLNEEDIGPGANLAQEMRYNHLVSVVLGGLEEIQRNRRLLDRAIEVGALEKAGISPSGDPTIRPRDFADWAAAKGLPIPSELKKVPGLGVPDTRHIEQGRLLPVAEGTSWEQIAITAISNDAVRIKTPAGERKFHYAELELGDRRKGDKAKVLWELLLHFAASSGEISASAKGGFRTNLQDSAKRLNKHLQGVFGIGNSIFQDHYKKHRCYRTRISFTDQRQGRIYPPPDDES